MINISTMTTEEKLQTMEILWEDLSTKGDVQSPDWHFDELAKREVDIKNGTDEFVDWDQAKKELLED
jgi:hypothetical protein